jgi:hypothetical protein
VIPKSRRWRATSWVAVSYAHEDLVERLPLEVGYDARFGRIAHRHEDIWPLVVRATEDLAEKAHRACVCVSVASPGLVQAREQQSDGDAHGLPHVVVLDLRAVVTYSVRLLEDDDQVGASSM